MCALKEVLEALQRQTQELVETVPNSPDKSSGFLIGHRWFGSVMGPLWGVPGGRFLLKGAAANYGPRNVGISETAPEISALDFGRLWLQAPYAARSAAREPWLGRESLPGFGSLTDPPAHAVHIGGQPIYRLRACYQLECCIQVATNPLKKGAHRVGRHGRAPIGH